MFNNMNNLQQRLAISSVSIISMLLAIYLSHTPGFSSIFVIFITAIISLAVWEYYHIAQLKGFAPLVKIGIIGTIAYCIATYLSTQTPVALLFPQVVLGVTLASAFLYYFIKGSDPFVNLSITFFGFMYLTIPLSFWILINYYNSDAVLDGRWSLVYLFAVSKMTDTGAFFIGRKFGRTPLCPEISPKKTWEGAIGGLVTAVLMSILLYLFVNVLFSTVPFAITFWQSIWMAVILSVVAQFGDLAESLLKRNMGVKDSSHLPGLGGVLDIVDSMVFTSPLMFLFLKFL